MPTATEAEFLVKLSDLDVAQSSTPILKSIEWTIMPGQNWRIHGDNGSGKTTLLKTLAGLIWPLAKTPPSRLYNFDKCCSHLLIGVKQYIGFASYSMQDEYTRQLADLSCFEVIASGLEQNLRLYQDLDKEQNQRVDELAGQLGLSKRLAQSFVSCSHGQKSAILFARALVHRPRLLILDEIFNGVDRTHFSLMFDLLKQYISGGGQVVLSWHEHGVKELERLFSHHYRLEQGRGVELLDYERRAGDSKRNFNINELGNKFKANNKLIEVKQLNVYQQNQQILQDINWRIHQGERWLISGENGAGKTTLLKTLMAQIRPSVDSKIWRAGFAEHFDVWQLRQLIGYASPELQQTYRFNEYVEDVVASGFFASNGLYQTLTAKQHSRVQTVLKQFDLTQLAKRQLRQLSSGQIRRVLIGRALVQKPKILILDEITANLDQAVRQDILSMLDDLLSQELTVLIVSHHDEALKALSTHEIMLKQGQVVFAQKIDEAKT